MIINWGDAPFKAFITVTYPSGTCTVTGEGQIYTHSGGGTATFTVKKKGTYTVKAVNGSCTDSKTASITYLGQVESLTLSYTLYIVKAGSRATNWGVYSGSIESGSGYFYVYGPNDRNTNYGLAYTNLSSYGSYGFKKITIDGYCKHHYAYATSDSWYRSSVRIGKSYSSASATAWLPWDTRGTVSMNVSSLNLSTYGYLSVKTGGTDWDVNDNARRGFGYIYNIYLTT